jgi:hypothetical protein
MDSESDRCSRLSLSPGGWPESPPLRPNSDPSTPTPQPNLGTASFWPHRAPRRTQSDEAAPRPTWPPAIRVDSPSPTKSDDPEDTGAADVVEESEQIEDTDMATSLGTSPGDSRRNVISPRPKGRENAKNTLCRNIGIYGHCRYENEGCAFNHDVNSLKTNPNQTMENRLVLSTILSHQIVLDRGSSIVLMPGG